MAISQTDYLTSLMGRYDERMGGGFDGSRGERSLQGQFQVEMVGRVERDLRDLMWLQAGRRRIAIAWGQCCRQMETPARIVPGSEQDIAIIEPHRLAGAQIADIDGVAAGTGFLKQTGPIAADDGVLVILLGRLAGKDLRPPDLPVEFDL